MKILQISAASEFGGAEKVEIEYCNQLADSGNEVFLLIPKMFKEQFLKSLSQKVKIILYNNVKNRFSLKRIVALNQILSELKPDIIHTHETRVSIAIQLLKMGNKFQGKHVHTQHIAEHWKRKYMLFFERILAKSTNQYIAVSSRVKEFLIESKQIHPNKVKIIPTIFLAKPVLESSWNKIAKNQLKHELHLPIDRTIILGVGRLSYQKGFDLAITAARLLKERGLDFLLVIVGDGQEKTRLDQLIQEKDLDQFVLMAGKSNDVCKYYFAADIFLLSSRYEGMPVVLSEAMAAGLPCVCFDVEGVQDIIHEGEDGFIVQKNDIERLALTLERTILRKEYQFDDMGIKARNKIESFITEQQLQELLLESYK